MAACPYFYKLKFNIFDAMVFPAWWEEAVNSIDFSYASRKAWSTINKRTDRSGHFSRLCPVSENSIALQLVENVAHKKGIARLRGSSTGKCPTYGKSKHLRERYYLRPLHAREGC